MAKQKITLTLDADRLAELRERVGSRSISSEMDIALKERLDRVRRQAAIDEWLADMEAIDGPIPEEDKRWAAEVFNDWRGGHTGSDKLAS